MTKYTQLCSLFGTPACVWLCFFCLASSSHHHLHMNFYYIFLLLLVVLSAYSESPQQGEPPDSLDSTSVAVCPNSSSDPLGVLAPILPQSWVFEIVLSQNEVNISVPLQGGIFGVVIGGWKLSNKVEAVIDFVRVKSIKNLTSTLVNGVEKMGWTIRILLESLQHVLKMYAWSLSENQTSVQFRCRLIGLLLKQSLFRKHDFAICVYKVYHDYQNLGFWHLKFFSNYKNNSHTHVREDDSQKSTTFQFYGGGKSSIFLSDELCPYTSDDMHEQQYQFLQCIKKDNKQTLDPNDGNVLCNMPLNVLVPKLTLKSAKELANLHDMYMPSKILLKNAHILLENHKCETCPDILAIFKPYKTASNAEYQQTWYQKNKEKHAKYKKQCAEKSEYQESNRKYAHKHYWSKKDEKFPPHPPSTDLCQQIVSDFCADTSPEIFEESGCAVCGKLTPICEMEELSEIENVSLLKVDGVTRKARCKSTDQVRELRGPILAPGCSRVCPICAESLDKKKMPTLALANSLWVG